MTLLTVSSRASASYDPIASGTATLTIDPGFSKLLRRSGIDLLARRSATAKPGRAVLQLAGGKADPTIRKAEIDLAGELILATDTKRLPLTDITLRTKPTPIFAKVGGGQLKLAKAATVKLDRDGFGNLLRAAGLKLTAKAATRFNKRLHAEVFHQGQRLGTLRAATQPLTVAVLPTGLATVEFDPTFYAKLKADSTSVNPIFPAEHGGPTYTFPIASEGLIAPDGRFGTLRTVGNLEFLRLGAGQVFWNEPWLDLAAPSLTAEVDLEPTPKFGGKLGRTAVLDPALTAPTAYTYSNPTARTVTITGAPLTLNAAIAANFNAAFAEGKPEFAPGELLGTLTFTAQTQ